MARLKNVEALCSVCNTVTKMELAGDVINTEEENKRWAKCKKCKQTMIIDLVDDVKVTKVSLDGIEDEECTSYSPTKTFSIGEAIFHESWNDFGKVLSKAKMSNGQNSISVEFQKSGLKKLIESLNV
ncbi:MAG: hypothetical protein IIC75_04500 [Bacteroidetes bacterium]|nr:hypothetical protein [Bacteroidota bacterium]